MKVFLNGFPKSGNHALWKACCLLGVPGAVNHVPFADEWPKDATHIVFIKRDPRDIVVSMIRMNRMPVTEGTFIATFRKFQTKSLVEELAEYEPWLTLPVAHVVRYESLVTSDAGMRGIAAHLGVPYIARSFNELPGMTKTWNAEPSDHRAVWSDYVASVWRDEGGPELLQRWGYA